LGFAVAWKKNADFIGRAALEPTRGKPLARRLVQIVMEKPEPLLFHNEPILRDGTVVGRITSGSYGHTLGRAVGMGYLERKEGVDNGFVESGRYEIEIAADIHPARVSLKPLYDPKGERIRM
jgi:4-methylaminobutanoate oxidase (formaldehyde-forming)